MPPDHTMEFAQIILRAKGDQSYEWLSKECGGFPQAKRLQQLATAPMKNFPDPETFRGLRRGTRVPLRRLILAAARSLGLDAQSDSDLDAIVIDPAGLRPYQVRVIEQLGRSLAAANRAEDAIRRLRQALEDYEAALASGAPAEHVDDLLELVWARTRGSLPHERDLTADDAALLARSRELTKPFHDRHETQRAQRRAQTPQRHLMAASEGEVQPSPTDDGRLTDQGAANEHG